MPFQWGTGTPHVMVTQRPPDDSQHEPGLVNVFIAFQMIGLVGFIITFITALCSSVRRHPTWYNFLASWIISCISYSLLFFGGQLKVPKPALGLCMTQASLVYAAPPFTAATTLGLVVQIWFTVRNMINQHPMGTQRFWTSLILALPWLLWCGIIAESVGFALGAPSSIRRTGSGMYCNTGVPIPGRVSAVLVAIMLVPAVVFEVLIFRALRRNWPAFKARKNTMSMVLRVFAFSVFGVFALALSLFFIFTIHHGSDLNIVVATIPVAGLLMFGSQRDLLGVYLFWKKKPPASVQLPPTPPPPQTPNHRDTDLEKIDQDDVSIVSVPFRNSDDIRGSISSSTSSPSTKSITLSVDTNFSHDSKLSVKKLPPLPGTVPEDALQDESDLYSATSPLARSPLSRRGPTKSIRRTLRPSSQQSLLSTVPWTFSRT